MQENFAIAFIPGRKVNEFTTYDESNVFSGKTMVESAEVRLLGTLKLSKSG